MIHPPNMASNTDRIPARTIIFVIRRTTMLSILAMTNLLSENPSCVQPLASKSRQKTFVCAIASA